MRTAIIPDLSAWHPADTTPPAPDMYICDHGRGCFFSTCPIQMYNRWDGERWLSGWSNFNAASQSSTPAHSQALPWRQMDDTQHDLLGN